MILDQLAAAIDKRLDVRIQRVDRVVVDFVRAHDVGVEVESAQVPLRILEHDEPELVEPRRAGRLGPPQARPPELAAALEPGNLALRRGIHLSRVQHSGGVDLRRRQAGRFVCAFALQRAWIERAAPRIVDNPILDAVLRIARLEHGGVQQLRLGRRQARRLVFLQHAGDARGLRRAAGPVKTRRAGDDAVEIGRKALRLFHPLTSACGTAVPVRQPWAGLVIGGDDLLRRHGHFMDGAPREIDQLVRMPQREARARAHMARVGRRGRVAAAERGHHRRIADRSVEGAVPHRLELSVPVGRRHPELDLDIGVARRLQRGRDLAERLLNGGGTPAASRSTRRHERARVDRFGERDRRTGQRQRRQPFARCHGSERLGVDEHCEEKRT